MITFFKALLGQIFPWYSEGGMDATAVLRTVAHVDSWQTTIKLMDKTKLGEEELLKHLWRFRDHKWVQVRQVTVGNQTTHKWKMTKAGQRYLENLS